MFINSMLKIPITRLHFPNSKIQGKNWLKLSRNLEKIDRSTPIKSYWSILQSFLSDKKISVVPPIFVKDKYDYFNIFFANQCSMISDSSCLPEERNKVKSEYITFNENDIMKILNALDVKKAHGHNYVSIQMLKICGEFVCCPLAIIFQNCLNQGTFSKIWKKANLTPIHKKGDKFLVKTTDLLFFNRLLIFTEKKCCTK